MTQTEMEQLLIDVVSNIQEVSGREKSGITIGSRPVLDVPGFDSLNGVEATVDALDRLALDLEFNNVFVDNEKALTIRQAAVRLLSCLPQSIEE
jgi:acyl carrier protein